MEDIDFKRRFEYENGFYLTAPTSRISKFATHMDLYRKVSGLPGEIIECGVFKGASLCRLIKFRDLFDNKFAKKIIGFDTFGPFPEADFGPDKAVRQRFIDEAGETSITVEKLEELLTANGLNENVELVAGNLLETAPDYIEAHQQLKISLLHIDVDLYEPTKIALECFFPLVVRGGIVILDDYGAFPGSNAAIDEYLENTGIVVQKLPYSNAISYVEIPR
jgi:hypothetical protein